MTTTTTITIEDLKTKTLRAVSDIYGAGQITRELAQEYADLWNAGPHFTRAIVGAATIINVNTED